MSQSRNQKRHKKLHGTSGPKSLGGSKSSSKREVYDNTGLPQEQEKFQINNPTLHLKELEKEQTKLKTSIRKEIIKMRTEINEIKTKS